MRDKLLVLKLDGDLEELIHAFLVFRKTGKTAATGGKDDIDD